VTLMRFDPFTELDRLTEQTLSAGSRGLRSLPMDALRRIRVRRPPARQEGDKVLIDRMTAHGRHGVLTFTIPVSEASKPRRVVLGCADRPSDAPNVVT
jgi:HSP20 family protein